MLDEHIERLFRSGAMISMDIKKTPDAIKKAVYKTLKANKLADAVVRISISRGKGPMGLDPDLCKKPTFVIITSRFREYPQWYYRNGIKISVVNTRRNFRGALNPQIKSLNFLNNILAKIEAKNRGAFEAVMLNYEGYLAEGTVTNVFFVRDGILYTPGLDTGILDGITRKIIIECAAKSGIQVREGRFRKRSLYNADEVFISNTTMEVMPVSRIDEVKISTAAGKITKILRNAYTKRVDDYISNN